jgi:uncharacterized protein DUF4397
MFRVLRTVPLFLALVAFGVFASSCGTDHSQVRFVNTSPDIGVNVDITVDGKSVATDLAFGSVAPSSGYTTVTAGNRTLEVFDTGTTSNPLINSNVSFSSQKQYTVLASGPVASIAAVVLTDDNTAPSSGNIKLRVVHDSFAGVSHDCGTNNQTCPLDIYIVTPGTDITSVSPTISGLEYQQASGYQSLTADTYEVIVTDAGTKNRTIDQSYALAAGQIRTLVVVDVLGGGSLSTVPLELSDLN